MNYRQKRFCRVPADKGDKEMKKSVKKRILPIALLAAFAALIFGYDENGRIIED